MGKDAARELIMASGVFQRLNKILPLRRGEREPHFELTNHSTGLLARRRVNSRHSLR